MCGVLKFTLLWMRVQVGNECTNAFLNLHANTLPHPQDNRVKIQAGLPSHQMAIALGSVRHFKNLEFTTMAGAFTNFTEPGMACLL